MPYGLIVFAGSPSAMVYTVTDKEVTYGTGVNSPVTRIEGYVTGGAHIDVPSLKEIVKRSVPVLAPRAAAAFATGGVSLLVEGAYNLPEALNTVVPEGRCSAIIKVFGQRNATRKYLATVALNFALAKVAPVWLAGKAIIVGAYATQPIGSEDEPCAELRLEFWASHILISFLFDASPVLDLMDWQAGAKALEFTSDTPPTWIGRTSNNSRGSYVREMVVQALGEPGQVPDVPPAPGPNADASGLV